MKLGKPATWRQLAPVSMVSVFIVLIMAALLWSPGIKLFLLYTFVYLIALTTGALHAAIRNKKIALLPYIVCVFSILHFSYGWGYLKGVIDFMLLRKKSNALKSSR